jgi:polysaccharide biosynthesis transport protein
MFQRRFFRTADPVEAEAFMKNHSNNQPRDLASADANAIDEIAKQLMQKEKNTEAGDTINYRLYLDALRKRAWLIALLTVLVPTIVGIYTARLPKLYKSRATVIVNSQSDNILSGVKDVVQMGTGGFWANEAFYQKELRILESRAVARRAGEKLGVVADDTLTGLSKITDIQERNAQREKIDPADFILGRFTLDQEQTRNIIHIDTVDPDPARAADISNALADAYLELNLARKIEGTNEAGTWLTIQNLDLKRKLEDSEAKLYAFMEENEVLNASIESQLQEILQRLASFNSSLAAVQARRIEKTLDAQALKDVRGDKTLLATIPEIRDAALIASLKSRLADLESERSILSSRYKPAHPKMQAIDDQAQLLRKNLGNEVEAVLLSLERNQASLVATESGLIRAIKKEREKEAKLNKLKLEHNRLTREVDTNARLYDMVTNRLKETGLTGALRVNNIMILNRARPSAGPFKPDLSKNIMAAIFLGLLLGILCAVVLDFLDNTIKNQEDVQNFLRAPFLGLLPSLEDAMGETGQKDGYSDKRDLFVFNNPKSTMAECARFIRTNLLFMSPDKPLHSITITSPGPQEGKTTMSVSLSVVMAQAGSRTIIIDTDLRRPRLHRALGVSNETGMSNVIVGQNTLDEAIQATDVPGLDVLVCGPVPPNPAEIFHTEKFQDVLSQLKDRYDRLICDSPPVGAVADPVILGTMTDGVIVVSKSEATSRVAAKQTIRTLADANTNLLGVVLNGVDLESRRYGNYYYQYYRRYGQYYGEAKDASSKA